MRNRPSSAPQGAVAASHADLQRQKGATLRRVLLRLGTRLAVALGVGAGVAYGLSLVMGVRWTWWVVPIGLVVESARVFRSRVTKAPASISPSGLRIFRDPSPPIHLVSAVLGTAIAFWGAFNQSSIAIALGGGFALLGEAFERGDEPA